MFDYMTVQETAKLVGISERKVQKLCKANCIEGVYPSNSCMTYHMKQEKPAEMRRKNYKEMVE